ncbi:MAG: M23 family metallopeptidase [Melioribacteraceae bacterium]|nr:M23 family metallopeptidase [Melioribacteraceae bacterium]
MYRLIIGIILFLSINISAGELKLIGKLESGSLIIGKAEGAIKVTLNKEELPIDENGTFIFGFDRDETGTYFLKVKYAEGNIEAHKLTVEKREYNIQRINNMKKKYVTAPNKELDRIAKEREIKKEYRTKIGDVKKALYKKGFYKPVKRSRRSSVFGSQRILNGVPKNFHNGVDYAAPRGTPVYAMTDGIVVQAADNFYYSGNFILIDHGQGLNSFYLHLSKKDVKEGDIIKKGQEIGEIGTTGRSTGPHLHWGVQWYNKRVDPEYLLGMKF